MIEKKLDIAAEDGTAESVLYAPDSGKHPGLLFIPTFSASAPPTRAWPSMSRNRAMPC